MRFEADVEDSVLCLVGTGIAADERLMRFAESLANAIEAPLTAYPAPRRGAVEWSLLADQAAVVVGSAWRSRLAALVRPHRSPVLATELAVPVVLVPDAPGDAFEISGGELVCGVDASRAARVAAQAASAVAARMQVPLALVHAQEPLSAAAMATAAGGAAAVPMEALGETRDEGWDLLDALDRITPKRARLRLRSGQPAHCLQDYAHRHDAPLVVIGTPDHGPLASLLLHSTAWELARIATVPVMYVPEQFVPSW